MRYAVPLVLALAVGTNAWVMLLDKGNDESAPAVSATAGFALGIVVDARGDPVEGARVEAILIPHAAPCTPLQALRAVFDAEPTRETSVATATTKKDGRFRLGRLDVEARYRLRADLGERLHSRGRAVFAGGACTTTRELRLMPGTTLRGRVLDPEGRGIRAWISATTHRDPKTGRATNWGVARQPTEPDGRFALVGSPSGNVHLSVWVPGRVEITNIEVAVPQEEACSLRLESPDGARIEGRVLDLEGRPIGGARVAAGIAPPRPDTRGFTHAATSRPDGSYELTGLPRGKIWLFGAWADGFVAGVDTFRKVPLAPEEVLHHDVILRRGAVLEGTLRRSDGTPLPHEPIVVRQGPASRRRATRGLSDEDGVYRIENVPLGASDMHAGGRYNSLQSPATKPTSSVVGRPGIPIQFSREGETRRFDLVLEQNPRLAGWILDSAGAPVAGAVVSAHTFNSDSRGWVPTRVSTVSDAEGRYVFDGLMPDREWQITAAAGRLRSPCWTEVSPTTRDPVAAVDLRLLDGRSRISGRGVGPEGQGVADARVELTGVTTVSTRADGSFTFRGLAAGQYEISARAGYRWRQEPTIETLQVTEGQHLEGVEICVTDVLRVKGTLLDPHGGPATHVRVRLDLAAEDRWYSRGSSTWTDERGAFTFHRVPPGSYQITAEEQVLGPPVVAGSGAVVRRLAEVDKWVVEGDVWAPDGTLVAEGHVFALAPEHGADDLPSARIRHGHFRMAIPSSHPLATLHVRDVRDATGRLLEVQSIRRDVRVDASDGGIEIRLLAGLAIAGRAVDPSGRPIPGVRLDFMGRASSLGLWAGDTTDAQGRFRLGGLSPGSGTLAVDPPEGWAPPPRIWAEAGTTDMVINLERVEGTRRAAPR